MLIAGKSEQHRMAERQQTGLAHQHVERQGEDDHHAHLAEHRQHEAGVTRVLPVVEQPGQRDGNQQRGEPRPAAGRRSAAGAARRQRPYRRRRSCLARAHQPARAEQQDQDQQRVRHQRTDARDRDGEDLAQQVIGARALCRTGLTRSANDQSITTEKVCTMPIRIEAMKQPASDPRPPKITTTNTIGPIASAMPDSVVK